MIVSQEVSNKFDELPDSEQEQHKITHYGNNIILLSHQNGQPKYMLGPHWFIFIPAFISTIILLLLLFSNISNVLTPFWFWILLLCSIIYAYSYIKIGLSYPGFAKPIKNWSLLNPVSICNICHTTKSRTTYHCQSCNICIDHYDHHCPWIGKCVGANNLNSFYFFLIMIFGTLIMTFVVVIASSDGIRNAAAGSGGSNIRVAG